MPNSVARCISCGHEAARSEFDKADFGVLEDGVFDRCPSCGSVNVDVYSASGIDVQRRIERVAAAHGRPAPSLDE